MEKTKLILAINPGSTSTKIAVYNASEQLFLKSIKHSAEELAPFEKIADQYEFRKEIILKEISLAEFNLQEFKVIIGRGGLVKPVASGVLEINQMMLEDLRVGREGQHASNLGGLIAYDIANSIPNAKAVIADPVVVDELSEYARISGHPLMPRKSVFHALNQKAIARRYAKEVNKKYEEINLIGVHLGGGISVAAHKHGMVIDVNQALDGDGPFSPERTGTLPVNELVRVCFSGKYSEQEVRKMIVGNGGYVAYLGTNDAYQVECKAKEGDKKFEFIQEAMAYQISKEIGAMATVLKGEVDAIFLTGGIAYSKTFVELIKDRVSHIASVHVYPGEDEMGALAQNALMLINGEIEAKEYV
ncbi:MAG: butyrate kinase [Bacteroidales bacterium]|jgi:butyrate kinase|nr:butyrate kinase [Bacteroidales bacterium]MDD4529852.1 butyrate kinase [Bacteroidales bacterium]MDD4828995.1 butyrate kinase [Bacteroidales bacterium]